MISGCMGLGRTFHDAICEFAVDMRDKTISYHKVLAKTIKDGRIQAIPDSPSHAPSVHLSSDVLIVTTHVSHVAPRQRAAHAAIVRERRARALGVSRTSRLSFASLTPRCGLRPAATLEKRKSGEG
jgi:hypothetical protein